jgi:hypothetical protein
MLLNGSLALRKLEGKNAVYHLITPMAEEESLGGKGRE